MPSIFYNSFFYILLTLLPTPESENVNTTPYGEEFPEYEAAVLNCTHADKQYIYSSKFAAPLITTDMPEVSGRTISFNSVQANGEIAKTHLTNREISLILDVDSEVPGFIVFNKRGKAYCSHNMGILNFPDHLSYRCLTKDRKIITAGYQKSNPIVDHDPVRRLVNDNINKVDIDLVLTDNIVIEFYETSSWLGTSYTISVKVSPMELEYYTEDIIAMMGVNYAKLENFQELKPAVTEADEISNSVDENSAASEPTVEALAPEVEVSVVEERSANAQTTRETAAQSDEDTIASATEPENAADMEHEAFQSEDNAWDEDEETIEVDYGIITDLWEDADLGDEGNIGARTMDKPEVEITDEEKEAIQREAEEKLFRLQDCFVMLTNRNYSAQQKQRERETVIQDLFINDRANVGVSSVNSEVIKNYLIGVYLLRLERQISAAYQKVEIVFSEIHKVSNFIPNPDGTWSATVTFSQQFRGFSDIDGNQIAYSDITQKNITVIIRRYELFTGDTTPDVYWDVLLSDIGVDQTQPF